MPSFTQPEINHDIASKFSIALSHIHSMRIQCDAAMSAERCEELSDPAIASALGNIYDALLKAGDDLEAVALERGESIGHYQ